MKHFNKSKIFVLSFLTLVFGTCAIPFFQILINFINEILFILHFYFFYQLQINLQKILLEQLLPSLIFIWLSIDLLIQPGLVKLQFSRKFRIFISTKVLKKELGFFTFRGKERLNNNLESESSKEKENELKELSEVNEIQYFSRPYTLKLKYITYFQKALNYLRYFFNICKSKFSEFFYTFQNLFLNMDFFRRGEF